MDDMNTTRPKLAKGVAVQWVRGTSELPSQQPPEKTELEKKKGRLEWKCCSVYAVFFFAYIYSI